MPVACARCKQADVSSLPPLASFAYVRNTGFTSHVLTSKLPMGPIK